MFPGTHIVTSPNRAKTLRASEEGAGKDERTLIGAGASFHCLRSHVVIEHSINVVNIAMLPTSIVNVVLGHRDLRSIEHCGLVHVVPNMDGICHRFPSPTFNTIIVEPEKLLPPCPGVRIEEVDIGAASGPAPSIVFGLSRVLYENIQLFRFLIYRIIWVSLHMRVDDNHHLSTNSFDFIHHFNRVGECLLLPHHILAIVRIFDIEPKYVEWNLLHVES
jgi:hypothetical protein